MGCLTNQANRRDDGRAAGPPRSVRVEREVRPQINDTGTTSRDPAMLPWSENAHVCVSRQSMNASVAATTQAMRLAQYGMMTPPTLTSHPKVTRSNWSNATSEKTTTATVVKGFTIVTSATSNK